MIVDFNDAGGDLDDLAAHVCIAGAGAAGITLALECERHGMTVLLIEGGGERVESATSVLLDTESGTRRYDSPQTGRAKVLGGATTLWAGQMLPLDAGDFCHRDWVNASGWPISQADLWPYYRRVENEHGLPTATYDTTSWPADLHRLPPLDPDVFKARFSVFLRSPRFNDVYGERLRRSSSVTVLTHANVTCIEATDGAAAVSGFTVRSLSGRVARVQAQQFVLACGGVETPRVLLASPQGQPGGRWNDHGIVGRYFHDHAHLSVLVEPVAEAPFGRMFHTRRIGGVRHYPKIVASTRLQQREHLLSVGADICYERNPDSPMAALKTIVGSSRDATLRRGAPAAMVALLRHPSAVGRAVHRSVVLKQKPSEGAGPARLCVQCESPPDPDSRVTLGSGVDALGMRRARVDWRIDERTEATICRYVGLLAVEFSRHRIAAVDQSGLIAPGVDDSVANRIVPGHHHMGATRMSEDPRRGVVDSHAAVHGAANLHVASTSVFPTSSFSNPTFTMLALTVRLGDRLKELCGR